MPEKGKNRGGLTHREKEKEGVIDERKKEKKGQFCKDGYSPSPRSIASLVIRHMTVTHCTKTSCSPLITQRGTMILKGVPRVSDPEL